MKRKFLLTTATILFASMAAAQGVPTPDELVAQYQADGATRVEVKVGPTQTKVEAINGGVKEEVIYDNATGDVIKREVEVLEGDENTTPGVEIDTVDRDFVRGSDRKSGSNDDDDDDDHDHGNSGQGSDDGDDDDDSDDDDSDDDDSGHDSDDDDDDSDSDSDDDDDNSGKG